MRRRVLFDTTRLAWRARRNSPTGIDRVLLAYLGWLAAHADFELVPVALAGARLTGVSSARLAELLASAGSPSPSRSEGLAWAELQRALRSDDQALALRRPTEATPPADWLPLAADLTNRMIAGGLRREPAGDIYLNVSHTGLHRRGLLEGLSARGVAPVVLVHDLIPITHPEYCTPGAAGRHRARMGNVLAHARLVIANSRATAAALAEHARAEGLACPPCEVAWLGIEPPFRAALDAPPAPRPYFVCVGTIEARKNLAFLLSLWRRLAESMGAAAPHLVLVGRRGWENEAVIDHLERSPRVRSLVHEVSDLSDEHLAQLMAGSRGLLAPSFAEGFDLPVAEALALGAPVLASDIEVHREVAAGARLLDPLDGPAWIEAIERASREEGPRARAPAPTWREHFAVVEQALSRAGLR